MKQKLSGVRDRYVCSYRERLMYLAGAMLIQNSHPNPNVFGRGDVDSEKCAGLPSPVSHNPHPNPKTIQD